MTSARPSTPHASHGSMTCLMWHAGSQIATSMKLEEELIELHDAPREVAPFSQRYAGLTPAAGYAAAQRLHAHRLARGWKPVGRKIGFTNRTLWQRYGVHEPMWGWVYDRTLIEARNHAASVALDGLTQPRIEPEIAFKVKKAPGG